MADKILGILYFIVYAVEFFLIGEGIFHNRVKETVKYATMAGVYLLVMIPTVLCLNSNAFIIMALNISAYIILFQGSVFSNIVHFGGVYLLTNMTESILFGFGIILSLPPLKHLETNAVRSAGVSLLFAIVVTGLILYVINRKWAQNFIMYFRALSWGQYLVIIMIAWIGILLLGIITVMSGDIENKRAGEMLFGITIAFMGTAFMGVVLLVFNAYSKDCYLKQNQIKEEIIHMQQMYYQNIYEKDREMRNFRHDIYSQLGCLRLLLAEGKVRDAVEHLQTIGSHFEELTIHTYYTGSEILDVIINQKIQEAGKKGIGIKIEGKMDKPDFMDTYDLCALFSNMLTNSIEACEAMQDKEELITVSILTHRNTVLFRFINPATAEMYEALRQGRTTKTDNRNHGFGMKNIQRVVDKNGGKIEIFFENGKIIIEIYFEIESA